jgi:Ca2+-transporting ATPase
MHRPVAKQKIAGLEHGESGLSTTEAEQRRARYGYNDIVETPPAGWRDVFRDSVKDPMLWFLAATSALFAAVGDYTEALVMAGAIVPLLGMDAFLHRRTQASTQGLRSRLAETASALRGDAWTEVRAIDLVPGDLVRVTPGASFPADGLIVGGEWLQADESTLTGESFPVAKTALGGELTQGSEPLVDGEHWGFAGTRLLTGEARVRIVDTGAATMYGEIVRSAVHAGHARTPLQHAIANLVTLLLAAAAALCLVLAWIRLRQGHGIVDALVSALTLAVAALPEEFPIVFTFSLGVGIFRLARHQALVRRAVVVENIGRVTCICSDKTGTLTEGRIRLAHYLPAEGVTQTELAAIAALASRADSGDPLDQAVLAAARGRSIDLEKLATFPFTEDRRRETAAFRARAGGIVVATKGAPETILSVCRLTADEGVVWAERVRELAAGAHKVIACAQRELTEEAWTGTEPDGGYRLVGLLACEDPVRDGVVDAVREAAAAGIRIIMITGDHTATARAVAHEVGIGGPAPRTIEGDRLESELAENGPAEVLDVDVIARAVPAQKLRIVQALQQRGEIVAVTGDGVNDVPALHAADIGIAMGERGTRSAREAGAIVLLDDNFRTIVSAIREGQQIFRNLRSSFAYLLMIHIPLVATATLIPLAGYPLLYLPIHIVWLELIIHPTALLVFQASSATAGLEPLREHRRARRFFSGWQWLVVLAAGLTITLVVLAGYERSLGGEPNVEHARTMALMTLVLASTTLTAILSRLSTPIAWIVAAASVSSAVILVQIPPLAGLLHVTPLHSDDWAVATTGGVLAGAISALFAWRGPRLPHGRGEISPRGARRAHRREHDHSGEAQRRRFP